MFSWAKTFSLLVVVAVEIVRYLQRRNDIDKAKLANALEYLERANVLVSEAQRASSSVDNSIDAILSDAENRDTNVDVAKSSTKPNGLDSTKTRV